MSTKWLTMVMKFFFALAIMLLFSCGEEAIECKTLNDYDSENRTGGIQLIGDSITALWPIELIPPGSYNRGICGNTTDDILDRLWLTEREQPEEIYLMIGINNLRWGWTPGEVVDGINEILIRLSISCPTTVVHVMGLFFSEKSYAPYVLLTNELIEMLVITHPNVIECIPTYDLFPNGLNTYDGTHPNYHGYELLSDRVSISLI